MSNKADFKVGAVVRGTDLKATIGLAWIEPETGRIKIKLFSFVHLPVATPDLFITLFPDDGVRSHQEKTLELEDMT